MSDPNSSKKDITYTSHNGTTPFTSAPCHTCPSVLLLEKQVRLKVKLVDANTEEEFGTLSVPFEVH